jgi:hypothetical protein
MERAKYIAIPIILTAVVVLASAILRSIPRRSDLLGTYLGTHWDGRETLLIRADGSFRQSFAPGTGPEVTIEGRWSVTGNQISFTPFLLLLQDGKYAPHTVGVFTIAWDLERSRLFFGEDGNYYVEKQ